MPKHAANAPQGTSGADARDMPIGLTEAFPPVAGEDPADPAAPAAPAADGDAPIGLTQAFPPVEGGGRPAPDAPPRAGAGAHAGGFGYRGDNEGEYPDALESLEPHLEPSALVDDAAGVAPGPSGRHGKPSKDEVPPYLRKSRRMRRLLIAVAVLLVLLIAALAYFTFMLVQESQLLATQQTQAQQGAQQEVSALQEGATDDAATPVEKQTEAPDLVALLGMTQEQATEAVQRGATLASAREVNEEGNPIKSSVTLALTSEPADTRTGTPTVYLGLNEAGAVVQAGYSASTAALGYGTLSFSDAVRNENIVEKTLQEAGIDVPEGSVQLPEDKTEYSTYASDGTTLVKESCAFSGTVDIGGAPHEWSAVLSYDYSAANASGNLADTIRIIYVYINA